MLKHNLHTGIAPSQPATRPAVGRRRPGKADRQTPRLAVDFATQWSPKKGIGQSLPSSGKAGIRPVPFNCRRQHSDNQSAASSLHLNECFQSYSASRSNPSTVFFRATICCSRRFSSSCLAPVANFLEKTRRCCVRLFLI